MIHTFKHNGREWHWNGFWGFFFQPVGPSRKKERVVRSGELYDRLRASSNYL